MARKISLITQDDTTTTVEKQAVYPAVSAISDIDVSYKRKCRDQVPKLVEQSLAYASKSVHELVESVKLLKTRRRVRADPDAIIVCDARQEHSSTLVHL